MIEECSVCVPHVFLPSKVDINDKRFVASVCVMEGGPFLCVRYRGSVCTLKKEVE